ncbi:MAG: GNAT family N-acetyltransferase [Actinomycetota bacterium]
MAPEVTVRLAKPGEEAEVASLIAGFRDFYEEAEPEDEQITRMVAELILDQRTEFLLVGEPAVGVAQLRFRPSVWTGAEDAWLEDLFVVEDARRAGAGSALVQGCVDRARARGCKRIQLDANERNGAGMALYESLGFSSSTSERFDGGRNLYLTRWL